MKTMIGILISWMLVSGYSIEPVTNSTAYIDIEYFHVVVKENSNLLRWATLKEANSEYFKILKSTTRNNFSEIYFQNAAGSSNTKSYYKFEDFNADKNTVYYQLQGYDINGNLVTSQLTKISRVQPSASIWQSDKTLIINLKNVESDQLQVKIFDKEFKLVVNESKNLDQKRMMLLDISFLKNGVYFMVIEDASTSIFSNNIVLN